MSEQKYLEGARKVYEALEGYGLEKHLIRAMGARGTLVSWSLDDVGAYSFNRNDADLFDSRRRAKQSFQRLARRVLNVTQEEVSDQRLDEVAVSVKRQVWDIPAPEVTVYRGDDLVTQYRSFGDYSIGACMSGEDAQEYLQFYAINPDIVGVAVLSAPVDGARLRPVARALVWDLPTGERVMDRSYVYANEYRRELYEWRDLQGYDTREEMSYPSEDCDEVPFYDRETGDRLPPLTVEMARSERGHVPYMDSFHYAVSQTDNTYTVSTEICGTHRGRLNSCSGSWPDPHVVECTCGEMMDRYHAFSYDGQYYCPSCRGESFTTCGSCGYDRPAETLTATLDGYEVCERCVRGSEVYSCASCRGIVLHTTTVISATGRQIRYCAGCAESIPDVCTHCGERCREPHHLGEMTICQRCAPSMLIVCSTCEAPTIRELASGTGECAACTGRVIETCPHCERSYDPSHMRDVVSDTAARVCHDCLRRNYARCRACGHFHHSDTFSLRHQGGSLSTACYCLPSDIARCDVCSAELGEGRGHRVGGELHCPSCYRERYTDCQGCGDSTPRETARRREGRAARGGPRLYCPRCAERMKECEHCGILIRRGYERTVVSGEGWARVCTSCAEVAQ